MMFCNKLLLLCTVLASATAFAETKPAGRMLDPKFYHLGDDVIHDWPEVSPEPHGTRLDIRFQAKRNENEATIQLVYWDVNFAPKLELNGQPLATLQPSQPRATRHVPVPPGALRDGENLLSFIPGQPQDDCVVGQVQLFEQSFQQLMGLHRLIVTVSDFKTGQPVPARVTITTPNGVMVPLHTPIANRVALRPGIAYMRGTETAVDLPAGDYVVYASRGMEWSRDKQIVSVRPGEPLHVPLTIAREVDTAGFIACDTHIHTLTFSGHGDATIEERMLTLAGEGVELAVATDHNHQVDYQPYQLQMQLNEFFTPVVGNEVTTKNGHFNAFPLPAGDPRPNHHETNWTKLVHDIRSKGAKVVILNHPRWPKPDSNPFLLHGLSRATGERFTGTEYVFDGMEVANSGTMQGRPVEMMADWLALLNRGEKVKAVGSSDSHTVGAPVGQGRTYLRSSTDNPAKIDIDEACRAFLEGDSTISLGIFLDVVVNGRSRMGQTVSTQGRQAVVRMRVCAPSWVRPQRAVVLLNGQEVASQTLSAPALNAMDRFLRFSIRLPAHDCHLVCMVLGDPVTEPFWRTDHDHTFAATNPVFLDVDGDGVYQSPRETAQRLVQAAGKDLKERWQQLLETSDDAVAMQIVAVLQEKADPALLAEVYRYVEEHAARRALFKVFTEEQAARKQASGS